jgi:hypothetical protein
VRQDGLGPVFQLEESSDKNIIVKIGSFEFFHRVLAVVATHKLKELQTILQGVHYR